jgi:hypothetical protein
MCPLFVVERLPSKMPKAVKKRGAKMAQKNAA